MLKSNVAAATTGASAALSPFWLDFLDPAKQVILALGGIVLLFLTIRNKLLDNRIKREALRDIEEARRNG
ncbi:hypothetical protein vBDshSR4C_019 [Dinoroseobacter phage vB_DshS-R4C]|nr:hypothetical protein vBDshSR4C_019 [Dinoroseobacter phage vB_DshS-R4C]